MVKRYHIRVYEGDATVEESSGGNLVDYSDYEKLEAKNVKLKETISNLEDLLREMQERD